MSGYSEDTLTSIVEININSWVKEEMELNKGSDVTREQRFKEISTSFVENLQEKLLVK